MDRALHANVDLAGRVGLLGRHPGREQLVEFTHQRGIAGKHALQLIPQRVAGGGISRNGGQVVGRLVEGGIISGSMAQAGPDVLGERPCFGVDAG
jgi:hypothetical protein